MSTAANGTKVRVTPSHVCLDIEAPPVALWRIDGQESGDNSGGPVVILVLTPDDTSPPDPAAAIEEASRGRYSFYMVDSITRVGSSADGTRPPDGCVYDQVVNQSGLEMSGEVANLVASLIIRGVYESNRAELLGKQLLSERSDGPTQTNVDIQTFQALWPRILETMGPSVINCLSGATPKLVNNSGELVITTVPGTPFRDVDAWATRAVQDLLSKWLGRRVVVRYALPPEEWPQRDDEP